MNSLLGIAGFMVDELGFAAVYFTMTAAYLEQFVFIIFLPRLNRI